ncbi:uncharacterized protein Gm51464 [Mus musculus]|uniref:uncharacterized protein Gm51464 n=1 Tax=Mus musculus TaxID=10090 RepID=UPI0005ABA044|nr:uncharacterized protein Gm51464 [Mus musculus]
MGGAAPPPAHAGGTGGRAQRQASGFLGPRIWRTLLLGGCNIRGGVFGVHGYTPPHPPSHLPHRAFPAIPDPVVAHRHGGSVLGAWSPAGGTVPCRPLPQPRPRAPIVPPPAPAARARDAGKEGGVMRWWRSFRCAPPVRNGCPLRGSTYQLTEPHAEVHSQTFMKHGDSYGSAGERIQDPERCSSTHPFSPAPPLQHPPTLGYPISLGSRASPSVAVCECHPLLHMYLESWIPPGFLSAHPSGSLSTDWWLAPCIHVCIGQLLELPPL